MTEINTNQNTPSQETLALENMPTISVDRTIGHVLSGFELDLVALNDFYDSLPHENKPSLSDISIHFSATNVIDGKAGDEIGTFGEILWDGTKSSKPHTTPELDKTKNPTIVIYVGTLANLLKDEEGEATDAVLAEALSENLTHELTHYAQGQKGERLGKAKELGYKALYAAGHTAYGVMTDTRWLKSGVASLIASEALTDSSLPASLKAAAGTAAIIHLAGKGKRRTSHNDESHERYLTREHEIDARQHQDDSLTIVGVNGLSFKKGLLDKITINENKGVLTAATRFAAREEHKKLALKAPVSDK